MVRMTLLKSIIMPDTILISDFPDNFWAQVIGKEIKKKDLF